MAPASPRRSAPDRGAGDVGGRPASGWGLPLFFGALAFVQGLDDPTEGLPAQPVRSLLGSWGESLSAITGFSAVLGLPWLVKPGFGLLCDLVPLAGTRRKGYLVATSALTAISFLVLASAPLAPGAGARLLGWLSLATFAVALGDVASDALMIELSQPRGLTGRVQAIQWASLYGAGIVVGEVGGALAQRRQERQAFVVCAVGALAALAIVAKGVREPKSGGPRAQPRAILRTLRQTAGSPRFAAIGGFLFLWNFNPFSNAVLHLHVTRGMGLGERVFGRMATLSAVASIVASLAYLGYCRRVPLPRLAHASIALGVLSTLGYGFLNDERSALLVAVAVGFSYMSATLIQLDLAARICPPEAAGTAFAILMALENLASLLSTGLGGIFYDWGTRRWGSRPAFLVLVAIGAALSASCWLLVRALPRGLFQADERAVGEDPPSPLIGEP